MFFNFLKHSCFVKAIENFKFAAGIVFSKRIPENSKGNACKKILRLFFFQNHSTAFLSARESHTKLRTSGLPFAQWFWKGFIEHRKLPSWEKRNVQNFRQGKLETSQSKGILQIFLLILLGIEMETQRTTQQMFGTHPSMVEIRIPDRYRCVRYLSIATGKRRENSLVNFRVVKRLAWGDVIPPGGFIS